MTSEKAALILGDKGTSAGAENGDFSLDLLNVIFAGFEVDLEDTGQRQCS
jgi:hypothetical protein